MQCLGVWREEMFTNNCMTSCTLPLLMSIWQLMLHAGNNVEKGEGEGGGGKETSP